MTSSPSQSSEELSDSQTPSAIGPCIEDDKEFIRNAREWTMANDAERMIEGGGRVTLLWEALRKLPSSLQKQVFLELLQGSDDGEDVWLWNEGDEALLEWTTDSWDSPPPWTSAAAALKRRLARTPAQTLQRSKVKSAAFEMRIAMIAWVVLTSAVYKSADEERGLRDREEWDIRELIVVWYFSLPSKVRRWFDQHRKSYDDRAFTGAMDQAGHSCHQMTGLVNSCWLFMRSQLFPTQQDSIIYLSKPTRGSESPPSWTPSCALVALRCMWDNIKSHYNERRDFSQWLSHQPIYGFKEANEFLRSLPRDTDENEYLSWVNKYPFDLRHTVTRCSLKEWQAMEDCVQPSDRGGSLNIRSWCAAMCWRMTPDDLLHSIRAKQFIEVWRYSGLQRWDFLPPPTPAPEFRDVIRVSGHTCWKELQMDDYTAAMAFLKEEAKVVGVDVWKYSRCQVCRLQWRLRSLSENLPVEERAFEADLTELEDMLRKERSRRMVARGGILASVQHHDVPGPMSNPDYQEQQDLHHILDAEDDHSHNMRTDHIEIHVPHRPRPPISQALHLTESNAHIFHPHTHIPDAQHHSTGLQHDHHSATAMAIADGIQDQDSVQYPSYTHSTGSRDVNYTDYGQEWAPYDRTMLQDFEVLQTQVPGRRLTPLLMLDLVNSSVENDVYSQPRDSRAAMNQDNLAAVSVQQIISDKADLSKDDMIKEIKKFFTESFEQLGVELHGTKRNKKLPWLQFDDTLDDEGIEMVNWPKDVLTPGKGSNSSKGLAGVPVRDLKKIYKAIDSDTAKLELRHIPGARKPGQAVSQQEFFAESSASGSRKRPRDAETDGDSRPKKRLVFRNIRYDGVMEAWKVIEAVVFVVPKYTVSYLLGD
ncbi:hypothetical protein C8J56DRAFT_1165451 [Mycena floridula]|nr:hypothetical protein C8J56DRAFT_1165451 [Mycena floridula]